MLDPQVEARSWDEQLALDDVAYRAQLAYLLERSPFSGTSSSAPLGRRRRARRDRRASAHREARTEGHRDGGEPGRRAPVRRALGDRADLFHERHHGDSELHPSDQRDLDDWVTGSARSYAASGISAGERIVSTYNAGPFVAGAALASST